jgi:uncharacterized protein with GYD domain
MAHYVLLMTWTESEVQKTKPKKSDPTGSALVALKDTLDGTLAKFNAGLVSIYWTLGAYDVHAVVDADSDVTVAGVALYLGQTQGVRTTTMRAFDVADMAPDPQAPITGPKTTEPETVADVNYRCHW